MRTTVVIALALLVACGEDRVQSAPASAVRTSSPAAPASDNSEAAAGPQELQMIEADALLGRMGDAKLQGLVVNLWASWCGSCKEEIPLLLGLHKTLAAEGIDFAFVSMDEPKDFPRAVALMRSWGGPLPVLGVANSSFKAFKRALHPDWRGALPATFLFDNSRKLRHFWEGPVLEEELTPVLQGLLAGQNIDGVTRTAAAPRP